MKNTATLLLILLIAQITVAQTIRRVNNNPGVSGTNVYSTAQAAHDAAAANDILIIEPSINSYGTLTLTKPLVIYGNGWDLGIHSSIKLDQRSSTFDYIKFNTGAGAGSGGSKILGGIALNNSIEIHGVSNITIQRCAVGGIGFYSANVANTTNTSVSNITISQCYVSGTIGTTITGGYTVSNVLLTNNIIYQLSASDANGVQSWAVSNNTFSGYYGSYVALANSVFDSNIIGTTNSYSPNPNFNNVTYSYNVSATNSFTSGANNTNNYDVTSDRQNPNTSATVSNSDIWILVSNSALKTMASDGGEVGAYGGTAPFIPSGIPAVPGIKNMFNTATGSDSTPLSATISVNSNN